MHVHIYIYIYIYICMYVYVYMRELLQIQDGIQVYELTQTDCM